MTYTAGGSKTQAYKSGGDRYAVAVETPSPIGSTHREAMARRAAARRGPTIASTEFDPDACPVTGCGRPWSVRAVLETRDGDRRVAVGCIYHIANLVGSRTRGFHR